jgi:flagellar hook-basal body complex protein FliE
MADINRELEELAELTQKVNYEMRQYGQLTKETADQKKDADMKAKHGIENFTEATKKGGEGIAALGRAGGEAAKAMFAGKKGAAAFNGSVDELTKAAQAASVALALMIPGGLLFKALAAGVTAAIGALGSYTKAANEMGDKLYEGYQGLAEAGAAASDGMTGLFEDAKKLGLSMDEISKYTELIATNSKDLALFAGTVFEGRQKFADTVKAMEPFKESLMNAGLSQDQINAGAMQYLRLQTRIGAAQNRITTDLGASAAKYMLEMDALTKLTGMSRKEQEEAIEAARSQQRFRAKLEELRNSGDARQIAAADDLEVTYKMLYARSKEAAQGYGDLTTGMITSEAAMKLTMSTQNQAMALAAKQQAGMINGIQAFEGIGKAVGKTTKSFNMLYQTGVGEEFLLKINEGAELGLAANRDLSEEYSKIVEEQKKQGAAGGKALDPLVQKQTQLRIQQQKANEVTERFVKEGIGPATDAMIVLAKATTAGTNSLNKLFGINQPATEVDKAAKAASDAARSAEKTAQAVVADNKSTRAQKVAASQEVWKAQQAERNAAQGMPAPAPARTPAPAKAPAAPAAAPAASAPAAPAASAAPAAAPAAAPKPAAPKPAAAAVAAPTSSAPASAPARPSGPDEAGAKPPADKEVKASPVGEVQEGAEVRIGNEIRKGGTVSWRTNNPGNISYVDLAKKYGAIGAWKNPKGDEQQRTKGIAIFPNIEAGNKLKMDLWRRPLYIDKTIDQGVQQWTGNYQGPGSTYAKDLAKAAGATLETRIRDLTDSQLLGMTEKQKVWEGFKVGEVLKARDGGMFSGPTSGYNVELHGAEAVIPLKSGSVPVQLSIKDDIKGLGEDVAEQLREIREQSNTSNETAMSKVTEEFKSAMAQMSQQLSAMAQNQNNNGMTVVAGLLQDLVNATKNGVDVQQKILASNY